MFFDFSIDLWEEEEIVRDCESVSHSVQEGKGRNVVSWDGWLVTD